MRDSTKKIDKKENQIFKNSALPSGVKDNIKKNLTSTILKPALKVEIK